MLILDRAPRKSSLKAATTGVQFVAPGTLPTGSRPTLVYVLDGFLGAGSAPKLAAAHLADGDNRAMTSVVAIDLAARPTRQLVNCS